MNSNRPHRLMAVPPTLHARLEIAKAIQSLVAEAADEHARRRAEISGIRRDLETIPELLREAVAEWRAELLTELQKYSPDQPRLPKGNPHGGEWTKGSEGAAPSSSMDASNARSEDKRLRPGRQYAQLDTGVRTGATVTNETTASHDANGVSAALSAALNWLQTGARNYWAGMVQASQAQIERQQAEARFAQEHPGVYWGANAALALPLLPEVLVGGSVTGAGGLAESAEGSFSIINWTEYPINLPKPTGPFRMLSGSEYSAARAAANSVNRALRANNSAAYAGKEIHEIQPVKFGGSPTDPANKIALTPREHAAVTTWWNRLQRLLQ